MPYPVPSNEAKRLEALRRYQLLDTPPEQSFDDFVHLASYICGTPIAQITLVDADRQWFKAKVGLDISQTPREQAFCAHTILGDRLMVVEDATTDMRFSDNPLVISDPRIRFYAGTPLVDSDGYALGSICVIDQIPRQLTHEQRSAFEALGRQVVQLCEFRRASADLAAALDDVKTLRGLLPICSHCKSIRNDEGYWGSVENYISTHTEANFSHGICSACLKLHHPAVHDKLSEDAKAKSRI